MKPERPSVKECQDLSTLEKMLDGTISRGKKQRIKEKIKQIKGEQPQPEKQSIEALAMSVGLSPGPEQKNQRQQSAKEKVDALLKKRDAKSERKAKEKVKEKQNEEDKQLIKQAKNKKRAKRREEAKDEDEFDALFKQHKQALLQKLKEKPSGQAFEEVDMSD